LDPEPILLLICSLSHANSLQIVGVLDDDKDSNEESKLNEGSFLPPLSPQPTVIECGLRRGET
jgi:hypothetical protein